MNDARWHAIPADAVLRSLDATLNGLDAAEAQRRLHAFGPNLLPRGRPASTWRVLAAQFRSVVVLLLAAASVIALFTSDVVDAVAIAAVLALNVAIGFVVEIRAHRAVEALTRLEARRATVLRDGVPQEIDAGGVVPGDVMLLDAGQEIPADGRLLTATELRTVEATLTGESLPMSKRAGALADADAPLTDRLNMVYAGTTVAVGTAAAVVVATGGRTELGLIGRLVSETTSEQAPLERQLDALGRQLVWLALLVGVVTALLAAIQGVPIPLIVQAGIAFAVAAVPEGLPAVATITLALGVHRMARRRALVRRLPAVETLGSVTVLCTDKTGTLTAGAMTVTTIWTGGQAFIVTGEGYAPDGGFTSDGVDVHVPDHPALRGILEIGALANRADAVLVGGRWMPRGDPTEAALIVAARKAGIQRPALVRDFPEIGEVPFTSERKLMATFHRAHDGGVLAAVKGAPHRVIDLCSHVAADAAAQPLDATARDRLLRINADLAAAGLRVLAVATGPVANPEESALGGLAFLGFVGMMDPPAAGVREAIGAFRTAGITTVMITGDQRGTAVAVAHDLGLTSGEIIDGHEVDRLSDDELRARLPALAVFSRISPAAKLRIVASYQRSGEIVAMIGDGVNDAAALKKADVGVTMGSRGTDVARETSAIVLQDDRFETIGAAIEEGRVVFANIRKFVFYLFSCNLAEIFVLLGAAVVGLPLPLHPVQILWLNLATDTFPALALAVEPAEPGIMSRPPRSPREAIVPRAFLWSVAGYAALIAASTFVVIAWTVIAAVPVDRARTMTFMVLAFAQLLHLGNARAETSVVTLPRMTANVPALAAVGLVVAMQALTVSAAPLAHALHVEPLDTFEWLIVAAASLVPAVAGQVIKAWRGSGPARTDGTYEAFSARA